ncbi:acyl-CoA dehydrogenase family protein [Rhodococcus koreensis]
MTIASTRWWGPELDAEQRALCDMLDGFVAEHGLDIADDDSVRALVGELAELGIWTIGTAESSGGGGADTITMLLALERLGRAWPALGWSAAQAHVAVDVLAGDSRGAGLVDGVHTGLSVGITDSARPQVSVRVTDKGKLQGSVDRIDAASQTPYLMVLTDRDSAIVVEPRAIQREGLQRTGFGGAFTCRVEVDADSDAWFEVVGVDVDHAHLSLRRGAAAVAAGIAASAASDALDYSRQRVQFGAPLTALPTVRSVLLEEISGSVAALSCALNATDPTSALVAMREATERAVAVTAAAIQSYGGYGYLTEYPAERRFRDAVSLRAAVDVPAAAERIARAAVGVSR